MTYIGIMEGRLFPPEAGRFQCFPREHWADEFGLAAKAGLDTIEWIYDVYGVDVNPLATEAGINQMRSLSKQFGVQVLSLCADYFMDKPLVRASVSEMTDRLATFEWLLGRCQLLGMNRMVVPFVDASRIDTEEEFDNVCNTLTRLLPISEKAGIELHLETSLPPERFAELLARLPYPMLKANYDSGNSSSLGYKPREEFAAYGTRIGSVHIKDRVREGGTVPLGSGDADFQALAEGLKTVVYAGDFILQVSRGIPGDEVNWTRQNREFVLKNFIGQR
ncbi:MAG TPA: sugar phosphate isomerase/epimerase family protein [Anaerolineales bacterium]